MTEPSHGNAAWPPYRVRARNISHDAGPSVHSDDVARSLGFAGALVAGRALYSHLLHPLLERYGEALLARGRCEVTFLKPAYEGDPLTIRATQAVSQATEQADQRAVAAHAENGEGVQVARLSADLPRPFPRPRRIARKAQAGGQAAEAPAPFSGEKREGSWEAIVPGRPLAAHPWRPTQGENAAWCEEIGEALPLFREGASPPLHPGLVPTATTAMLHEQLLIRGWVHASSVFITHALLRAGQALELRATPIDKWEKDGRRFVKLHVAVTDGARVFVEEIRTALIKGQ